jgi:dipeptidyl aminopeptidase/acylaminoacyl peptidase
MGMFKEGDVFAAGAALAPVSDWAHEFGNIGTGFLGDPHTDSLAYVQSSPIYFAEGLHGALLLCHGILDHNVHFQQSVRLVQRLIELSKEEWEIAIYPMEDHYFQVPASLADMYKRIFQLFEKTLK